MKGLTIMAIAVGFMVLGLFISGNAFYNIPKTSSIFVPVYYTGALMAVFSILPLILGSFNSFNEKVDEVRKFHYEHKNKYDTSGFPGDIVE